MPRQSSSGKTSTEQAKSSVTVQVFSQLREMAIRYELKPGERLNEEDLAERLGVSRTPIREALYRLAQDGFLVESGRGYSRRQLDVKETLDLYEARSAVEAECVRLVSERASDETLSDIERFLETSMKVPSNASVTKLVELDEAFHEKIALAAGNAELLRILRSLNERIRFIRWINMENVGRENTQTEHLNILTALRGRRTRVAQDLIKNHITKRTDQIVESITTGLARIYLGSIK